MAVKERGSEVVFLRQVIEGAAEKSFGIHVARLAGLPSRVVERAESVLRELEETRGGGDAGTRRRGEGRKDAATRRRGDAESVGGRPPTDGGIRNMQHGMAASSVRRLPSAVETRVEMWRGVLRQIAEADVANMTPVQALNLLNDLQMLIRDAELSASPE